CNYFFFFFPIFDLAILLSHCSDSSIFGKTAKVVLNEPGRNAVLLPPRYKLRQYGVAISRVGAVKTSLTLEGIACGIQLGTIKCDRYSLCMCSQEPLMLVRD